METIAVMIIILGIMIAIVGIRQEQLIKKLDGFMSWFYMNIDFTKGEDDES